MVQRLYDKPFFQNLDFFIAIFHFFRRKNLQYFRFSLRIWEYHGSWVFGIIWVTLTTSRGQPLGPLGPSNSQGLMTPISIGFLQEITVHSANWIPNFQKRPRISIRGSVRPLVGPSVRPSVRRSVTLSSKSREISILEQISDRGGILCSLYAS